MELALSPEDASFRDEVRAFISENYPKEMRVPNPETDLTKEQSLLWHRILYKKGWIAPLWPKEYGGPGWSITRRFIFEQETSRAGTLPPLAFSVTMVGPVIYTFGNDAQKQKFLPRILSGEDWWCQGYSEPGSGSDLATVRTKAVRDGDHYIVNGTKRFITGADKADFMILMAATDRAKGSRGGISCFLVDMDTPGVRLTTSYRTLTGESPWEIALDNVHIPVRQRVGDEGGGFRLGQKWLGVGRVKQGARALGAMRRCLELAASYAKQRVTFGKAIAERQSIQWRLVDTYMALEAATPLVYRAAEKFDRGQDNRNEAYLAKLFCTEAAWQAADMCLQVHGGLGLTTDLPIERFWRDQRSHMITEGTPEIMRMALARHVLDEFGT
jgi:alkylation response protein AidB-like acyl-CoA dehydrogenase